MAPPVIGFSRGAFTARSLAGLVRNSGILRRYHADRILEAWALYRDRIERPNGAAATLFRRSYARETEIGFIGVWDTVGALGIPVPDTTWLQPAGNRFNHRWAFHNTELSSWIKAAFHALAADEQRSAFRPTLWHQNPGSAAQGQELKQVWFAGVHCDVGGGYKETGLSDIALLWMVDQARRHGLEFDADALSTDGPRVMQPRESIDFRVRPDGSGVLHVSRAGMYRLAKPLHRPLGEAVNGGGEPDGNEFLAVPAKERYDRNTSYRPPELERYLARQERVRLEPVLLPGLSAGLPPMPPAASGTGAAADAHDGLDRAT
ncbi:phospholipase effector Tle1 domain-containing protein [Streptomyces sp. QTS137]